MANCPGKWVEHGGGYSCLCSNGRYVVSRTSRRRATSWAISRVTSRDQRSAVLNATTPFPADACLIHLGLWCSSLQWRGGKTLNGSPGASHLANQCVRRFKTKTPLSWRGFGLRSTLSLGHLGYELRASARQTFPKLLSATNSCRLRHPHLSEA
jgi:hypothetical protein